ncbi:MAG: hypothetical protein Q7R84_02540 [bacterium]|nr:hypothetical protein [bacterium]
MKRSFTGWRNTFYLESKSGFVVWISIVLLYLFMVALGKNPSGTPFFGFNSDGTLAFLITLAIIFTYRKLSYYYFCGECLKEADRSDNYCRQCGTKFREMDKPK